MPTGMSLPSFESATSRGYRRQSSKTSSAQLRESNPTTLNNYVERHPFDPTDFAPVLKWGSAK
jgi:hypothetical protein